MAESLGISMLGAGNVGGGVVAALVAGHLRETLAQQQVKAER